MLRTSLQQAWRRSKMEELVARLEEMTGILRQNLEQGQRLLEAQTQLQEEQRRMATAAIQLLSEQPFPASLSHAQDLEQAEERRQERDRRYEEAHREQAEFRSRLLAAFERQSELLVSILLRLSEERRG